MSTQPTAPQPTGTVNGLMAGVTMAHLILVALAMLLVVIAIIYGSRLRSQRRAAEREEDQRMAAFDAAPPPPSVEPTPTTAGIGEPRPAPAPPPPSPMGADVPVPAADVFRTEPAALAPAEAAPPGLGDGPLTQLKGLGPRAAARLGELGVTRLDQLAALDEDAAERLDADMGPFRGRLTRDRWVEQARFLAAGDRAGFEAVFGRL